MTGPAISKPGTQHQRIDLNADPGEDFGQWNPYGAARRIHHGAAAADPYGGFLDRNRT